MSKNITVVRTSFAEAIGRLSIEGAVLPRVIWLIRMAKLDVIPPNFAFRTLRVAGVQFIALPHQVADRGKRRADQEQPNTEPHCAVLFVNYRAHEVVLRRV